MPIDVIIHGACGRMGKRLVALATEDPRMNCVGAIDHPDSPFLGQDAGEIASGSANGVIITSDLDLSKGQLVIDFALPVAFNNLIDAAVKAGVAVVSGTTGIQDEHYAKIEEASKSIPVLYSPNMSVGVNLMFLAARQLAEWVGEDFDIEVVEAHHRFKKDAPSGTALRLGEMLAEGRGLHLKDVAKYTREGVHEERAPNEIGIQSIRGGDIVGEHTAYFTTFGERLELTHRATSRDIFVRCALRAAHWLSHQKPGKYSIFDMISLKS